MGIGIAAAHVKCGIPVTVTDAAPDALAKSQPAILEEAVWLSAEEAGRPAGQTDDLVDFLLAPVPSFRCDPFPRRACRPNSPRIANGPWRRC